MGVLEKETKKCSLDELGELEYKSLMRFDELSAELISLLIDPQFEKRKLELEDELREGCFPLIFSVFTIFVWFMFDEQVVSV